MRPDDEILLVGLSAEDLRRNGVPDPARGEARTRAIGIVRRVCEEVLHRDGVRVSPLGPEWGGDVDVYVRRLPPADQLRSLGWIRTDELLSRIGSRPAYRWAVVEAGDVLATADFHVELPPDPLRSVLSRCLDRGEVRAREVLELRELTRGGARLPEHHPVVRTAATAERALGGALLPRPGLPPASRVPTPVPAARWRHGIGSARRVFRPHVVIAVSGVDGAGKSTAVRRLLADLERLDVPVTTVWSRPGMGLGPGVTALATGIKRLMRQAPQPGVRVAAQGRSASLRSRRGVVGWLWTMLVTVAFIVDVRRQQARARGVVVYDRHRYDALATLDFAYEGVDLRVPRFLVSRLLPRADVTFYLDVPAEVAVARKPDDTIGATAVARQLDSYAAWRGRIPHLVVLDGTRPTEELSGEILRVVLGEQPGTALHDAPRVTA